MGATPAWSREEVTSPGLLWAGMLPACCWAPSGSASCGAAVRLVHMEAALFFLVPPVAGRGLRGHDWVSGLTMCAFVCLYSSESLLFS